MAPYMPADPMAGPYESLNPQVSAPYMGPYAAASHGPMVSRSGMSVVLCMLSAIFLICMLSVSIAQGYVVLLCVADKVLSCKQSMLGQTFTDCVLHERSPA